MIVKAFEIRDADTFIPALAIKMVPTWNRKSFGFEAIEGEGEPERWLLRRAGFNFEYPSIILCRMEASGVDRNATYDPYAWGGDGTRTMTIAHDYLEKHFDELESGAVIDVEFLRGESNAPKISERL